MIALSDGNDALELVRVDAAGYAAGEEVVPENEIVAQGSASCGATVHGGARPERAMTMRWRG